MVSFVNKRIQKLSKSISEEGYNVPYSLLMKLFKSKSVKVGGKRVDKDIVVNQGETIELYYTPKLPELSIVYEDKNVVVVNKEIYPNLLLDRSNSLIYRINNLSLKNLDLLITIDTSVLHLAGAMGVKTFLLFSSKQIFC